MYLMMADYKPKHVVRIVYTYHKTEFTQWDILIYLTGPRNKVQFNKTNKSNIAKTISDCVYFF
jgi:hypothetical protein